MSGQQSIADLAVSALAAVKAMDEGLDMDEPERHAIREMKRAAEQAIENGLRVAMAIVWASKTVGELVDELRASPQGADSCKESR